VMITDELVKIKKYHMLDQCHLHIACIIILTGLIKSVPSEQQRQESSMEFKR
jgi:hypothetical protein